MLKRYHHIVGGMFRVVDALVIGIAWLAAYWIRFEFELVPVTKGFPSFASYASLLPLVMILWSMILSSMGAYRSRRMLRRTHEIQILTKAHFVSILVFISLTFMFSEYRYSRLVMGYFGLLGGTMLVFFRIGLRNLLREMRRRGKNLRHILMVGEGDSVEWFAERVRKFPELGYRIAGCLIHEASGRKTVGNAPVLGKYSDIERVMAEMRPDQVVIALPRQQYEELETILSKITDETVDVRLIPDVHEYVTLGCEVEEFEGLPVVNLNGSPMEGWGMILKRMTDFLLALIALVFISPLLLLLALALKLTSPGPVFFRQERMGLDGRTFSMYKFRSMRVDAESDSGAVWAKESDPRRTRLGALLRSTSLDELPQLWNVLRGEMSLVGPRPERPVFVEQFRRQIPHYMLRHKVKAGLTGWAQVNGWRGNTSLEKRIECDLFYIRNWSYFLDLKIMLMTVWRGFVNKNAY